MHPAQPRQLMVDPEYALIEGELRRDYGPDNVKDKRLVDRRQAFRLIGVGLPEGCQPPSSDVLLIYAAPNTTPEILVGRAPTLPNGRAPKNINPTTIDGEPWFNYSVQWSWNPSESVWRNVTRKLMRFASAE